MAYFNHAFSKMFLGTAADAVPGITTDAGLITQSGISTTQLSELSTGYFGFFDAKTYASIDLAYTNCCPLILASSSVLQKDKIGPFHGGYRETNKSKVINPKYVQQVYRVDQCVPKQAIVSVGYTPQTAAGGLDPNMFQGGTTDATCCFEFLCGETYYLRIDVKGSPALRALNHNAYQTLSAYTGCCSGPTPVAVDSTLVFIEWAKALIINNYLKDFVLPVVFDETGAPWYAPGTTVDPISGAAVTSAQWWTAYVSPGHTVGDCGGLRLFGAFVETKFGNCTFQVTDFFEKEPIKIYASMVDYTGDPCVFEGICVYNDCLGLQGMGFGEQVVRDLIRAESYLQNFFHSGDFRVREITQGYDITSAIDRNALYTRYYILHSVPRFNNPTGTFDNDRYLLEIITEAPIAALDTFLSGPFLDCVGCEEFGEYGCTECTPEPNFVD
jgi:hypothetical protein